MRLRHSGLVATLVAALALPAGAQGTANPMDSIAKLPGYRPAHDTIPLLDRAGLDRLPQGQRAAWEDYLARSRAQYARDTAAMQRELASVGARTMVRAPYAHDFTIVPAMTAAWFHTDSAARMAAGIRSFQAPNGGWSKHVDFAQHARRPGESYFSENDAWQWISTIDNDATTTEMTFLARRFDAAHEPADRDAFVRGVRYLLDAQYPNGCWPQVYPLEGSYHDAVTFNDDATVHAARMLDQVGRGQFSFVPAALRQRSAAAVSRTVRCILDSQVIVAGRRTIWGQQHHPLTLAPVSARSYELTSLAPQESSGILLFLMDRPAPSADVVRAVDSAMRWLRDNRIFGLRYDFAKGVEAAPGAGPVWARMVEIPSGRPVFSNRDGTTLYDWNQLTDRRHGYGWYSYAPAVALERYGKWRRSNPHPRLRQSNSISPTHSHE